MIAGYKEQIADNQVKAEQARRFKATLYENMINGLITKGEYRYDKDQYTAQIEQAQEAVDLLRKEMERATSNASDRLRWTQHFKEFSTMTELDRRAVVALIHSIKVIGKNDVKITFRYQIEYEQESEKLVRNGKNRSCRRRRSKWHGKAERIIPLPQNRKRQV